VPKIPIEKLKGDGAHQAQTSSTPPPTMSPSGRSVAVTPRPCPAVDRPPTLVLQQRQRTTIGLDLNMTYQGCNGHGILHSDWSATDGPPLSAGAPLTLRATGGAKVLRVEEADYRPATGDETYSWDIGTAGALPLAVRQGAAPGDFIVAVPPTGKWSVLVTVSVAETARDVTWQGMYHFRITVKP
jgi:hypothetical protein